MQIPPNILKCVVYLGCMRNGKVVPSGTGFLVSLKLDNENLAFYLVTAKHVVKQIEHHAEDRKVWVRINFKTTGAEWVATTPWLFHPGDALVDVAVSFLTFNLFEVDHLVIHPDAFLSDDLLVRFKVGPGDDLFMVGLFANHYGSKKNLPIVRVGTIAALPEDKVSTQDGDMDVILIESRSIGGLSGSPVFLHLSGSRTLNGKVVFQNGSTVRLLGLVHGHFEKMAKRDDYVSVDSFKDETFNMGIAMVVPMGRILEVLNQPLLAEAREKLKEALSKKISPDEQVS